MPIIWAFLQNVSLKVWKWIAGAAGVLLTVLYFFSAGKRSARRQVSENNAKLIDKQFEESTHAPKSKEEELERVRSKGL